MRPRLDTAFQRPWRGHIGSESRWRKAVMTELSQICLGEIRRNQQTILRGTDKEESRESDVQKTR